MPRLIALQLARCLEQGSFSRWYRAMMMESHSYLITSLLLTVAVLALLEAIFEPGAQIARRLAWIGILAIAVISAIYSIRSYFHFLMRAEHIANQATCGDCGVYGRLRLIGDRHPHCDVACKRCGFEWTIIDPDTD
ncbi:MAG: hypothetical protein H9535_15585 [Ignavibacteria bacterium]|jgi:hypothetical protein|nr:hypothetical protein [Ignavibacteria bacterium]